MSTPTALAIMAINGVILTFIGYFIGRAVRALFSRFVRFPRRS